MSGIYLHCRSCLIYRPRREFIQPESGVCRNCEPPVTHQRCTGCGFVKPIDEYHCDRKAATGRRKECKQCRNAQFRTWHNSQRHKPAVTDRLAWLISRPWA